MRGKQGPYGLRGVVRSGDGGNKRKRAKVDGVHQQFSEPLLDLEGDLTGPYWDNNDGCRRIWYAVLHRALLDGLCEPTVDVLIDSTRHARQWLLSDEHGVGTFRWIADMLGLSSGIVSKIRKQARQAGVNNYLPSPFLKRE